MQVFPEDPKLPALSLHDNNIFCRPQCELLSIQHLVCIPPPSMYINTCQDVSPTVWLLNITMLCHALTF